MRVTRWAVGGGLSRLRAVAGLLRGIYGDTERYVRQYWSRWRPMSTSTGDGAKRDKDAISAARRVRRRAERGGASDRHDERRKRARGSPERRRG